MNERNCMYYISARFAGRSKPFCIIKKKGILPIDCRKCEECKPLNKETDYVKDPRNQEYIKV